MAQLEHDQTKLADPPLRFTLLCCGISSPANAGGLFRLADAAGVDELIFAPPYPNLDSDRLKRTSRESHKWIGYRIENEPERFLSKCKDLGRKIIGLELTTESIPMDQVRLNPSRDPVLVLGSERNGIPDTCLALCDHVVHIPMYGQNSSMNVVVAAGVALFSLLQQSTR